MEPKVKKKLFTRDLSLIFSILLAMQMAVATTCVFASSDPLRPQVRTGPVFAVRLDSSINPATYGLVKRALKEAEAQKASALIILLDTPGGLVTTVRKMVQLIMSSSLPVVVYVYPPGARAASAGAILTIAADVAAMAPGTNIGAAHPVDIGGNTDENSTMAKKSENDLAALAVSIAQKRKRNVKWAEEAVRKSIASPAQEALKLHVIDLIAKDIPELISRIRGKVITLADDSKVMIAPRDPNPIFVQEGLKEKVLKVIADPNVAYILLMMGMIGLYFEFAHPGVIFPGSVGAICLLLALYALHTLSANAVAVLLILLAFILFVLELFITSHGILAISGTVAIVMGSLMLFDTNSYLTISNSVLWPTLLTVTLFFFTIAIIAAKAALSKPKTGPEALIGTTGVIKEVKKPGRYMVFVHGELWEGLGPSDLHKGQTVKVTGIKGLKIEIEPKEE